MPNKFSRRADSIELMDDLTCEGEVIDRTLVELEFINKWLGGNAVTVDGVNELMESTKHIPDPLRIADLGCGGGDILKLIGKQAARRNIDVWLYGIDANENIIEFARRHSTHQQTEFHALDIFSNDFKELKIDIAVGTLFFHHFTSIELIDFFKALNQQVSIGIVINDIHRHWFAYHSIKLLTGWFSKSAMVKNDAPISVLRAFSKQELQHILHEAGITSYTIRWRWAFRWQIIIKKPVV